jgi:hypothetical protein
MGHPNIILLILRPGTDETGANPATAQQLQPTQLISRKGFDGNPRTDGTILRVTGECFNAQLSA